MGKRLRLVVVGCLGMVVLMIPPAAQAGDTICGIPGSPTLVVITGVHDNVLVPEGASCWIGPAIVKGNVKALPDSHVFIITTTVGGNVIGDKADMVQVTFGSAVHGNIQIKEGGPNVRTTHQEVLVCGVDMPNGDIHVQKMTIAQGLLVTGRFCSGGNQVRNGNVTVEDNFIVQGDGNASGMSVDSNQIANGNLHVFKNVGVGGKQVTLNNVVNGDIQCYENQLPFLGGPNTGRAPNQPPPMMLLAGKNQCFGTST